ncbi:MAG: phosphatidylserine decarboxylase family protein [Chloroflexota bacterium]
MLTRYGIDNIIIMILGGLALVFAGWYVRNVWASVLLYAAGVLLVLFTLWFFRDPDRELPPSAAQDESFVISPADGEVVAIETEDENEYINEKVKRISIFLSPLDVHVNRNPVSGVVEYYKYIPGKYLVAFHPKSSDLNEQSRIGVRTRYGKVLYKQIVGIVARRLVCELRVGDTVKVGERFGMMKFGSRMDVKIRTDSKIFVKVGDKVRAGVTELARLNGNSK